MEASEAKETPSKRTPPSIPRQWYEPIWRMHTAGLSPAEIAHWLEEEGAQFTRFSIRRLVLRLAKSKAREKAERYLAEQAVMDAAMALAQRRMYEAELQEENEYLLAYARGGDHKAVEIHCRAARVLQKSIDQADRIVARVTKAIPPIRPERFDEATVRIAEEQRRNADQSPEAIRARAEARRQLRERRRLGFEEDLLEPEPESPEPDPVIAPKPDLPVKEPPTPAQTRTSDPPPPAAPAPNPPPSAPRAPTPPTLPPSPVPKPIVLQRFHSTYDGLVRSSSRDDGW